MTLEPPDQGPEAKVFARGFATPPGAPWDQWSAARLEARHGAPLPVADLHWSLRRLDRWRAGAEGRFAVAYMLRSAVAAPPGPTIVEIEGAPVRFSFGPPLRLPPIQPLPLVVIVGALALSGFCGWEAWRARVEKEAQLSRLEDVAQRAERLARRQRQAVSDARAVERAGLQGRSFADLTEDLTWLGANREAGSVVQGVVWTPEGLEARLAGDGRPVVHDERAIAAIPGEQRAWRIGRAPPPVVRGGVARPSIMSKPAEPAQ